MCALVYRSGAGFPALPPQPRMVDWMGGLPAKPGNTSWGLPVELKANFIKEFKTFLSCPEIAQITRVFSDVCFVTYFLLKVFHRTKKI